MTSEPLRIGVLGCGMVSDMYLPNLVRSPAIDLTAVADSRPEVAAAQAAKYGTRPLEPDQLLADPGVELVLNLTPIAAHVQTTTAILAAGKHVYSEKTLGRTYDEASSLRDEADRRGLVLACAPDTLLGTGFSVARRALLDGAIGTPLSASAVMLRAALTGPSWYTDGPLPFLDMGPYYVSALVHLFGPARSVTAITRAGTLSDVPPTTDQGSAIELTGVIDFVGGASATLQLAWGSSYAGGEVTRLDVFGGTGVINFPNPNNFGDPARIVAYGHTTATELPGSGQPGAWNRNLRGLGVAEVADAIRNQRQPRTGADVACHVVEVINGLVESGAQGQQVKITSGCVVPPPISDDLRTTLLGV